MQDAVFIYINDEQYIIVLFYSNMVLSDLNVDRLLEHSAQFFRQQCVNRFAVPGINPLRSIFMEVVSFWPAEVEIHKPTGRER